MNAQTISEMNRAAIWSHIDENSLPVKKQSSTEAAREALTAYYAELAPVIIEDEVTTQAKNPKSEPVVCRVHIDGKGVLTLKGKTLDAVIAKFDAWAATKPTQTLVEDPAGLNGWAWVVPRGTAILCAV